MGTGDQIVIRDCAALTALNAVSVLKVHVTVNLDGLVTIVNMHLARMNAITEESVS